MPDEAQKVHEEEQSNATLKPTAESGHETVQLKNKVYDPLGHSLSVQSYS